MKIGKISAKIHEIGKIKAIFGLGMTPIYGLKNDQIKSLSSEEKGFNVIFTVYILVSISFNIIFVLKRNRLIEKVLLMYTQHMFNCFGRESYIVLNLQKPH